MYLSPAATVTRLVASKFAGHGIKLYIERRRVAEPVSSPPRLTEASGRTFRGNRDERQRHGRPGEDGSFQCGRDDPAWSTVSAPALNDAHGRLPLARR